MMPSDRMPSVSVGVIVPAAAVYDTSHHWPNNAGVWHASVRFDAGGYSSAHIQGEPAALRELAAALVEAADQADEVALAQDSTTVAAVAEGVAI